jgi:hypothetical protein
MTLQYTYDNKGRAIGVFIPITEWKKITKKYKELETTNEDEYMPPTKQEVLNSIKEGLEQVKLHQQGKIKLKTAQQLLDEL